LHITTGILRPSLKWRRIRWPVWISNTAWIAKSGGGEGLDLPPRQLPQIGQAQFGDGDECGLKAAANELALNLQSGKLDP